MHHDKQGGLLLLHTLGNTQPPPLEVMSMTSVVSGVGAAPGYLMGMHLHRHKPSTHQPCCYVHALTRKK
jgi:hypothetical protein